MSIVEKTIRQLIHNRVHDLTDLVMEVNATPGRFAALELNANEFSLIVVKAGSQYVFSAALPSEFVTDADALKEVEAALSGARRLAGGAQ